MTVWFVSRHPGAVAWAKSEGLPVDHWVEHLRPEEVKAGDVVLGTLPVGLASEVCARGARFFSLTLDLTPEARGKELDLSAVRAFRGRLEEFVVTRRPGGVPLCRS